MNLFLVADDRVVLDNKLKKYFGRSSSETIEEAKSDKARLASLTERLISLKNKHDLSEGLKLELNELSTRLGAYNCTHSSNENSTTKLMRMPCPPQDRVRREWRRIARRKRV